MMTCFPSDKKIQKVFFLCCWAVLHLDQPNLQSYQLLDFVVEGKHNPDLDSPQFDLDSLQVEVVFLAHIPHMCSPLIYWDLVLTFLWPCHRTEVVLKVQPCCLNPYIY